MSVIIETTDGPLEVNDFAISAIACQAERQAEMAAAFLKATSIYSAGVLPPGYLLELGATLQLTYWEKNGVRLPAGIPAAQEAIAELVARVNDDPAQFNRTDDARLSRQLLAVWVKCFGWDAQAILEADVTINEIDEDALVDALAPLLWQHRNRPAS